MGKHLFWLTLFAISCRQSSADMQTNKTSTDCEVYTETANSVSTFSGGYDAIISEDFVKKSILSIEEVKQKNRNLDAVTKSKNHLFARIFKPTADEKCYYVQVGYDNKIRFVTCFNFYINPATKEIRMEDVLSGDRVTITEWRKRQRAKI